jgi:cytochrome c oxidase subunit 2
MQPMSPFTHAAGPAATRIAHLGVGILIAFSLVAVAMWILVFWVGLRRRGSFDELVAADDAGDNRWIKIGGIAIPVVVLTVMLGLSLRTLAAFPLHGAEMPMPASIQVIGHQWWWEIRYQLDGGTYVRTANAMHLPARAATDIELATRDVIHSFWVPELHGKVDLVPGVMTRIRLEPDRPGQFGGRCAEYCGLEHGRMSLAVTVDDPDAYAAWLTAEQMDGVAPATDEAKRGQQLFLAGQCSLCHTVRGTPAHGDVGPDLTHFGSRPGVAANAYPNTDENVAAWISRAQHLKPGAGMPDLPMYGAEDLRALTVYVRSLK